VPELFVWYHADPDKAEALRRWVASTEQQLHISVQLYVRCTVEQTTFMEVYTDISETQQQRLQQLVTDSPLFGDIERHSELFQRLL